MNDFLCVTLDRAAQIFRAMNGDADAQKAVTFQDIAGLTNAPTFAKFLLWNKERLEVQDISPRVYS